MQKRVQIESRKVQTVYAPLATSSLTIHSRATSQSQSQNNTIKVIQKQPKMRNRSLITRQMKQKQIFSQTDSCTNKVLTERNLEIDCSLMEPSTTTSIQQYHLVWQSPYRPHIYTIYFPYPQMLQETRSQQFLVEQIKKPLYYKLQGQVPFKCILSAFEAAGFERIDEENWLIYWGLASKDTLKEMKKYQKTNHFPGCWSVGRKDNLWIHLSKVKRKFPTEYYFIPNTYLLQYDFERFEGVRESAPKKTLWIKKPVASARGNGIKLINKKTKLTADKRYLVMDYISNPHLINNFKYDLRVYVLITSIDPLRVYMYKDGLVRFATQEYSLKSQDIKKRFIHLTNFSVNKQSPNFIANNQDKEQQVKASKWSHKEYKQQLTTQGINHKILFKSIEDVVLKTCIAAEPLLLDRNGKTSEHKNNYFELFGFDILIDETLKPWLLEVNVSPSLNSASDLDAQIKTKLISDMLHLIGVEYHYKKAFRVQIKKRLYERNINEIQSINSRNFRQKVNQEDLDVMLQSLEEQLRLGQFKCLYPNKKNIWEYDEFFEYPRFHNKLIQKYFEDGSNWVI
ncbi:unnamed protein product [Paramecium octaurelia]|uniref:Tubulin--tyrosine ligase-like protein 5 n=1 Tax=Paramecium octaurelia TaxID=43137 RepID=A0A8S1W2M1_PAROT|nr:unnamed protein product [Paramecium octaurelia]